MGVQGEREGHLPLELCGVIKLASEGRAGERYSGGGGGGTLLVGLQRGDGCLLTLARRLAVSARRAKKGNGPHDCRVPHRDVKFGAGAAGGLSPWERPGHVHIHRPGRSTLRQGLPS